MCGIFGFQIKNNNYAIAQPLTSKLLKLSEERGRESSGICLKYQNKHKIFKMPINGSKLSLKKNFFKTLELPKNNNKNFISIIGQCRLTTNGKAYIDDYNQPVNYENVSLIHNGIILNINEIFKKILKKNINDNLEISDTLYFAELINYLNKKNSNYFLNFNNISKILKGSFSIAFFDEKNDSIYLSTNNGSLYFYSDENIFLFASEKKFIENLNLNISFKINNKLIKKILPGQFITVRKLNVFFNNEAFKIKSNKKNISHTSIIQSNIDSLIRCKKCLLPTTYPYIKFNKKGICNYCKNYKLVKNKDISNLEKILDKHRSKDGSPDCLVGLSGGRDSGYGLHVLVKDYGMNPIAYTYDWGLTTNISRRNQALITGKLGIEHIIRSPKIDIKRENIRKNIYAWLLRPKLGMVPLFMAGDKDFYEYGRTLKKDLNLKLTIFCSGQHYEQGNFFIGFCGVKEDLSSKTARLNAYPLNVKAHLAIYYIIQYILNPNYLNSSFFDSIKSFFTSFVFKDDFLYLYEYLNWNEKKIENTLKKNYQWEEYESYGKNQWRMGDGQTAFINYIYFKLAGFSEFDDFRSKQIRDGLISRKEALELVKQDNQPKYEVLNDFANTIGINLEHVLSRINNIEPIY